ncbi:hypothetical protein FKP32DRAFT_1671080 [Trametes sanguinea]|nr:hypothetical protein FKP32DRAFT_1671080 [Trametes sanguinea]
MPPRRNTEEAEVLARARRQAELRKERNRRYHLKRKQRRLDSLVNDTVDGTVTAASSKGLEGDNERVMACRPPEEVPARQDSTASSQPPTPMECPNASDALLASRLTVINDAFLAWGFKDDPQTFLLTLKQGYCEVQGDPQAMDSWRMGRSAWLTQGEGILKDLVSLVSSAGSWSISASWIGELWQYAPAAMYRAQYMMAATQVYIDMLQ